MSVDEYTGPVIGVVSESVEPCHWQYGMLVADGRVMELDGTPTRAYASLVRRPMAPTGGWREVHDVDL